MQGSTGDECQKVTMDIKPEGMLAPRMLESRRRASYEDFQKAHAALNEAHAELAEVCIYSY